ncbi:MAG: hypothetical protein LPD71_00025 [Shewanella sp.]|nr:hypothetical protein [Shewanella sp.]MCF1437188.1 hypothetical protein [Shewanella sp.]MCF1459498.1 hypothetical protein [Shewanella sp.]
MSTTFDHSGKALTVTEEGVTSPADYTFDTVNDFVHRLDTNYEDLECLCLGMAKNVELLHGLLLEAHGYLMFNQTTSGNTDNYREDLMRRMMEAARLP